MIETHITERIGIHKVALCFLEKFGWIEREQYVADYGIDTQVEIVENGKPTGLLYCIQVKAGTSYLNRTGREEIVHYTDEKHVNYWLNHSLPVLLIICNPESDTKYWDFVTRNNVAKTKKGWKVIVPQKNSLDDENSRDKIRGYYFSVDNFTIVESVIDTSHGLSRRISMKIVLKRETSHVVIEDQLPKLVEGLKNSEYYRSEIVEDYFRDQPADCVWIWFYRDYEQYKNGLPFCTAYWNHPNSKSPTTLSSNDKEIKGIFINYAAEEIPDELINRRLSKGRYLKIVDRFLSESSRIYEKLQRAYHTHQTSKNFSQFKSTVLGIKSEFENLLPEEYHQNNAPLECADLDQIVQNIDATIDNVFIVASDKKRDESNVIACVEMYLKTYADNIIPAVYERKKAT